MIKRSRSKQKLKTSTKEVALIRENTATLYGLYFATSNTDFLLNEKKTRFSVRPDVILKQDRQTAIFDYSTIKGSEQASIFDGFFRGLQEGTTCAAGVTGCSGATCCGSTLGLAGAVTTTCNFINDVTGIPKTDFADTYTLSKVDVTSKTIVAIKETPITTTTAVQFNGDYFIDLPQWTKTQENETSTPVKRIINLLSSQSLEHLGIRRGSVLEFKKTKNNNSKFTVVDIYNENGFEVIEVDEEITKEDVTDIQVIVSVYGEESPIERLPGVPPLLPAPILGRIEDYVLNRCCPCYDCLLRAMNRKEAEAEYDNREGCNIGCSNQGRDCGPYQIRCNTWVRDVCGPPNAPGQACRGGHAGGAFIPECCELCTEGFCDLDVPCPEGPAGDACCAEKQRKSKLLIKCWQRRYLRNQGSCECSGPDNRYTYPSGTVESIPCCTCEDIARKHNGGPSGTCNTNATDDYWKRVKEFMKEDCPNCSIFDERPTEGPLKPANDPEVTPGRRR